MSTSDVLQHPNGEPVGLLLSQMEKVNDASDLLQRHLRMSLLHHDSRYDRTILNIILYDMGLCCVTQHLNDCRMHTSGSKVEGGSVLLAHSLKWFSLEIFAALLYLAREPIRMISADKRSLSFKLYESEVSLMLDFLNENKEHIRVENTSQISSEVDRRLKEYISVEEQKGCSFLFRYIIFGVDDGEIPSTITSNSDRNLSDICTFDKVNSILSTHGAINGLYPLLVSSDASTTDHTSNRSSDVLDPAKSINTIADSLFAHEDVLGELSNRDRFQYLRQYIATTLNRILVFRKDGVFSLVRTMLFDDRVSDSFTHDAITHIVNLVVNPFCAGSNEESFRLICFQLVVALRKHYFTAEEEKLMSNQVDPGTTDLTHDEIRRKARMKGISLPILENWLRKDNREAELALSDETLGDRLNMTFVALCDSLLTLRISKVVKNGKVVKGSAFDTLALINRCLLGPLFASLSLRRATKTHATDGPGGEVMASLHALWAICYGSSLMTGKGSGSFLLMAWETVCCGFLHLNQHLSIDEHFTGNKEIKKPLVSLMAEVSSTTTAHHKMRELAILRCSSILNLIVTAQSHSLASHMDRLILPIVSALSQRDTSKQLFYWADVPQCEGTVTFQVAALPTRASDTSHDRIGELVAVPTTLNPDHFINHIIRQRTGERKEGVALFIRKMMYFASEATLAQQQALQNTYSKEEFHEDAKGVLDALILVSDPADMFGLGNNTSTSVTLSDVITMLTTLYKLSRTTFKYFQMVYALLVVIIKGDGGDCIHETPIYTYSNPREKLECRRVTSESHDSDALYGVLAVYISSVMQCQLEDNDSSQHRLLEGVYHQLKDMHNFIMSEVPLCLANDTGDDDSNSHTIWRDCILLQLRETAGKHLHLLTATIEIHFSQINQRMENFQMETTDTDRKTDTFPSDAVRLLLVKLGGYVSEAQFALSTKTNKSTIAVSLRCCCDILEELSDQHRSFSEQLLTYVSREVRNEELNQFVCPPFAQPLKALALLSLQTFVVELSPVTQTHVLSTTDLFVRSTAIHILAIQLLQRLDGTVVSSGNPYTRWWLGGIIKEILVQSLSQLPSGMSPPIGLGLSGKNTPVHTLPAFPVPVPNRDLSTLVLLLLEVLMAVNDNDTDGMTMKKLDDCVLPSTFNVTDAIQLQKTSYQIFPLLQQIIIESSNELSPIFDRRLTVSALYISAHVACKLYPRVDWSDVVSLCKEVFVSPSMSMMAKAAAAASFRKFVVFCVDLMRSENEQLKSEHETDHISSFHTHITTGNVGHFTRKLRLPEKRNIIVPKTQTNTLMKLENIVETCSVTLSQSLLFARHLSVYRPNTRRTMHNSFEGDDDDEQSVEVIRYHGIAAVHLIEEIRASALIAPDIAHLFIHSTI